MTRDLRSLFLAKEEIGRLEKSQLCSVEPRGLVSRRREFFVGKGLTLDRLVQSLLGHAYDGQIKVVSRDGIRQTSLSEYNPAQQTEMIVRPGDLVYIEGRQ